MKFSTGSSSSSLASDSLSRKSTLCIYTEDAPAPPPACERMDSSSEAMELRRELEATRSALQQQSAAVLRQRHQLAETALQLAGGARRAERERRLRADQLALVLRSLVLLEARLARDQKQLHAALQQKDAVIGAQRAELDALRARTCPRCAAAQPRGLDGADARLHGQLARSCSYRERAPPAFQKNTRLSKSFQLPREATSSSEDGAAGTFVKNRQAFVRRDVLRRSRKYSGRKHDGAWPGRARAASSSAEDAAPNQIAGDIRRASLKIDQLIGENLSTDVDKSYSEKMERFHGIRRQASDEIKVNRQMFLNNVLNEEGAHEKPWYCSVSDPDHDTDNSLQRVNVNGNVETTDDNALDASAEVVSAKNAVLCGEDGGDDAAGGGQENWYTSASDGDEAPAREIYKNNPVLECVNQILLQDSLDDGAPERRPRPPSPKPPAKRVQFSTLNSISCDAAVRALHTLPRADRAERRHKVVKFSLETASEHSYEVPHTAQGYHYEIQSAHSDEYEPIVTERPPPAAPPAPPAPPAAPAAQPRGSVVRSLAASIERHYRLGEERASALGRRKAPRAPPALPPKPKNLTAKLRERARSEPSDSDSVAADQRVADVGGAPAAEPDYCSISEINVPVVSHGGRELLLSRPTVELHRPAPPAALARVVPLPRLQPRADRDIPRLPHVTEILIPEDDERPPPYKPAKLDRSIQMGNTVSSILSEINLGAAELGLTALDAPPEPPPPEPRADGADYYGDKFDLSQNFEEFKIDEELAGSAEEYRISSGSSDGGDGGGGGGGEDQTPPAERREAKKEPSKNCKLSNKPDLLSNIDTLETDAESSSSSSGSYNTVKCEPAAPQQTRAKVSFDFFLESSGLSSKAIVTPGRARPPAANHRHNLKPRDVKMRVKAVATTKLNDRPMTTAIKYFEPYV